MRKRIFSLTLAVLMCLCMFPLSAVAVPSATVTAAYAAGTGVVEYNDSTPALYTNGEDYFIRLVNPTSPAYLIAMLTTTAGSSGISASIQVGSLANGEYNVYVDNVNGQTVATGTLTVNSVGVYTVTVNTSPSNGGTVTGGGSYAPGDPVTIAATSYSGYRFSSWAETTSTGVSLSSTTSATATFTMPASNVTITAYFTSTGGSGGGGGGGGGGTPTTPKDPDEDEDKPPTVKVTELRLSGYSQIDTAIALSKKGWPEKADAVVLAYAYSFPDALAAASLAYKENAPILLTDNLSTTQSTLTEIQRLNPSKVILVGGTAVLSSGIENALQENYQVTRYAGIDRYATAAQVADAVGSTGKAVVVSGEVYHDALVISSYAANQGLPILFTERDALPDVTSAALSRLNVTQTIVAGGTGVVGSTVYAQLPSPTRYAGYDCYETATTVANAKELKMNLANVYVVTGANFPDALVAGNLAAHTLSPLIMVDGKTSLPAVTESFFKTNKAAIKGITVVGGTAVVPADQVNAIRNILNN